MIKGNIKSISFSGDGETWENLPITPATLTGKITVRADLLRLRDFIAGIHLQYGKLTTAQDVSLPRFAFAASGSVVRLGAGAWSVFCSLCERHPEILGGPAPN